MGGGGAEGPGGWREQGEALQSGGRQEVNSRGKFCMGARTGCVWRQVVDACGRAHGVRGQVVDTYDVVHC